MNILLATPYLHPEGGGLERYADALSRQLTLMGHAVTQVGFARHGRYEYEHGFRRIGVPYAARLSNTPVGLELMRTVRSLLREQKFDVVNGHAPVPGAAEAAFYAARAARVPFVITYHAGRLAGGTRALDLLAAAHRHTFERTMLAGAAAHIAVSPYVAERALAGHEATVVPPGVDTDWMHETAPRVHGRILFAAPVSRAYAWKGFDTLFEAFLRLARERPHAHLRAIGGGERDLQDAYLRRVSRAGLAGRLTFGGRVGDAAMPREYSRAEVVALPSTSDAESFGMTLAEANACARPVVATRIGGIPFFVRPNRNGLLVEPGDIDGLAVAIARLLDEPDFARALGASGRERVRTEHAWEALAARTVATYARACGVREPTAAHASTP